jgi:hypothetical protein
VMDMDDELLEMMTVETKQTTISDFYKPVQWHVNITDFYCKYEQLNF